jgi:hypothetical protein
MEQETARPRRHLVARELFRARLSIKGSFVRLQEPSLIVVDRCDPYSARPWIWSRFEFAKGSGRLRMDDDHVAAIERAFRVCYPDLQAAPMEAVMVPVHLEDHLFVIPRAAFETVLETEFDNLVTEATMYVFPGGGEIVLRRFRQDTEKEVRSSIKQLCQKDADWNENLRREVMALLKKSRPFDSEDTSRDQANFCILAKYQDDPCGFLIATVMSTCRHGRLRKEARLLEDRFDSTTDLLVYIDFAFLKEELRSQGMGSLICWGVINHLRENYLDKRLHILLYPKPDNPKAKIFWSEQLQLAPIGGTYLHRLFNPYRAERMAEVTDGLSIATSGLSNLLDSLPAVLDSLPTDEEKAAFLESVLEELESIEALSTDE